MRKLIEPWRLLGLGNLVAEKHVKYFVEPDAQGSVEGLELAAQLNLHAFIYEERHAKALTRAFPDADIFERDRRAFWGCVLPKLDANTIIWGDLNAEEREMIERFNVDVGQDWFIVPKSAPQHPEADKPGENESMGN